MCAKNHSLIFSSFLDIWENVEWPRFFGPPGTWGFRGDGPQTTLWWLESAIFSTFGPPIIRSFRVEANIIMLGVMKYLVGFPVTLK